MADDSREVSKATFDAIEFNESNPNQSLRDLYDATLNRIDAEASWYATHANRKRVISWMTRGVAVLAIALATLLLDAAAFFPDEVLANSKSGLINMISGSSAPGFATLALVLAGIALLVDKTFIVTRGMTRFRVAQNAILKLRLDFEGNFNREGFAKPPQSAPVFYELKAMATDAIEAVFDVVAKETEQWQADTQAAVESLRKRVEEVSGKSRERQTKAKAEKEKREEAEKPAILNVTINRKDSLDRDRPEKLRLDIEGPTRKSEAVYPGAKKGFLEMKPGRYLVKLQDVTNADSPVETESTALVLAPSEQKSQQI